MTLVLYQVSASSPCRAVRMLAKELNVELEIKDVDLRVGEQLKPEFLKMNPQHTVPTLADNGFYLWESRAILRYLVNKYAPESPLYPKDHQKKAVVDGLLDFDLGTLYKSQADYIYPQLMKGQAADSEKEEAYKKALGFLEGFLEHSRYVAGDNLSLADFSILASLTFAEAWEYDLSGYPNIVSYLARLKSELPYYHEVNDEGIEHLKQWISQMKKSTS